ncbi:MAG TPA: chemotaxis protein CheX [Candidatus Dormibacteraeota bacterium]|nr:chemotaxis protein CheX [Candidatus Dormibacteraeota bacterium]
MTGPKSVEPSVALPRSAWPATLQETVIEVFSIMARITVTAGSPDAPRNTANLTGIIGIAGAIRGNFILQCNTTAAVSLASHMLGISPDDPNAQKAACDALGEICNIVAGYFKARVGLGDACKLSVPTIIVGRDYRFRSPKTYERIQLPLVYEGETLWATLEIAQ